MKHYFKYLCASFLIFMSGMMSAQNKECFELKVSYVLKVSASSEITGEAGLEFQGKAFHMKGNGIEAYCDGVDIWTIDSKAKEVYIESLTEESELRMMEAAPELASMKAGSEASFDLPDGMKATVKVRSIKKTDGKDISFFRPDYKFDSSWVITDLR